MSPCYFSLDCITASDGQLRIIDVHGGVGSGLTMLAAAYGGQATARARLAPYLERLTEVAGGRRILFVHDPFVVRQPFPDDFFNWVQRFAAFCPVTDWVPDLQESTGYRTHDPHTPAVEQMGLFLDPLARQLRARIAYCSLARIDYEAPDYPGGNRRPLGESGRRRPMVLLSGYRERARHRPTSVILPPEEIGVVAFSGRSHRFPEDLKHQSWFSVINPPLLERLLESRWLLGSVLEGTPSERLLPRWIPVGMGMRTASEVREFAAGLQAPDGFPIAVLKPSHVDLSPGVRFLDRTAVRALAARQPERRLQPRVAGELVAPRIAHSYEEISAYRGKLLDNLLRTPGAEVHDHGDGTFHYSSPYPFLETTVAVLQEYVEARPVRSRKTGKFHQGLLRAVFFDGNLVAAIHRLDAEPDDGTFRDLARPDAQLLYEAAPAEDELEVQAQLGPFVRDLERGFQEQVRSEDDLTRLREGWLMRQTL